MFVPGGTVIFLPGLTPGATEECPQNIVPARMRTLSPTITSLPISTFSSINAPDPMMVCGPNYHFWAYGWCCIRCHPGCLLCLTQPANGSTGGEERRTEGYYHLLARLIVQFQEYLCDWFQAGSLPLSHSLNASKLRFS